jgi:hypothetical protein
MAWNEVAEGHIKKQTPKQGYCIHTVFKYPQIALHSSQCFFADVVHWKLQQVVPGSLEMVDTVF